MAKRRCKFGKVSRGKRKGHCRTKPYTRKVGGHAASALYGVSHKRRRRRR